MMGLPDCREVARRLSLECDRELQGPRSLGLRLHLLICRACRRYQSYLRWLEDNLPRALTSRADARLSDEQRASIQQALRRHED